MKDISTRLREMRRPPLLIRAARIAAQDYCRDPHLGRVLGADRAPRAAAALMELLDIEAALDVSRRKREAGYTVGQHVAVLTAVLGEARLLAEASAETERPVARAV